ncbi:DnaD domain protein [Ligilactobacillus sp. LYQ135]
MGVKLLPTDSFKVVSKATPEAFHFQALTQLYQPFIGSTGVSLYMTLAAKIQLNDFDNLPTFTIKQLLITLSINLSQFEEAKKKLEAVGLIKTYCKNDPANKLYLYELIPCLDGRNFFDDPLLSSMLMEYVGEYEFTSLLSQYEGNRWNEVQFKETTHRFNEVFQNKNTNVTSVNFQVKKRISNVLNANLDYKLLKQLLEKTFVNVKEVSSNLATVNTIAVMYGLDEFQILRLLEDSVDVVQNTVNWRTFKSLAAKRFEFELVNSKSTGKETKAVANPKLSASDQALVASCEQYSPMEFLNALKEEQGSSITHEERITISSAVQNNRLNSAVINVLTHYMLVDQGMSSLNQKYFERTANDWLKNQIKTPQQAIEYVRQWKEKKKKQSFSRSNNRYGKQTQFNEKMPSWAAKSSSTASENTSTPNKIQDIQQLMQKINDKTKKRGDR